MPYATVYTCKITQIPVCRSERETFMDSNAMEDHHEEKGTFLRDALIWAVILVLLGLWALSILKWGVLGLYMPAVISVPILLAVMVWISRG
jgi:hypothetical protein